MKILPLAYWVHDLSPFLFRLNENFGLRYYGLSYLLGFLAAGWLLRRYYRAGRSPLDANAIIDLLTLIIVGVIVGGRCGYFVFYQTELLFSDPLALFRVWEGGMSSHGGMLGVALVAGWFTRGRPYRFLSIADLIVTVAPLGLCFGRIANFINGELWGKPTRVPWAVIFPASPLPLMPRHPSQLYAAVLEGLFVFGWMQIRFWKSSARQQPGRLSGEFLVVYSVARTISEIFREPDAALLLGLSRGTFYSLFFCAAGLALIATSRRANLQRKA